MQAEDGMSCEKMGQERSIFGGRTVAIKHNALRNESVHVRGPRLFVSAPTHVVVTVVVRQEKNNVWLATQGWSGRRRGWCDG